MARQFLIGMLIVPYLIICKLIDLCRFIYWAIKLKFYRAKNKPQSLNQEQADIQIELEK